MTPVTPAALATVPAAETSLLAAPAMTPSSSAASSSSNLSAPPSTVWSADSSRRSSADSLSSVPMAVSASADNLAKQALPPQPSAQQQPQQQPQPQQQQPSSSSSSGGGHNMDPLMRTYPKPEQDINVSEALRREPLKWTLGYWAKNARDLPPSPSPAVASPATLLEQKKQELRRAQLDLDQVVQQRRR